MTAYNPNQPRVPAGDHYGGRWTGTGLGGGPAHGTQHGPQVAGAGTALPGMRGMGPFSPAMVPYLHGVLSQLASDALGRVTFLGGLLVAALDQLGAVEGELPQHPDIRYRYKSGVLTLWQDVPGASKPLLFHGPAGADGLYRLPDGTIVGRDLGDGVFLNEDASEKEKQRKAEARAFAIAEALRLGAKVRVNDEPELCPAPTKAQKNNDKKRWREYQEQITEIDSDLEILLNGVSYDGCRNIPGGIVLLEAKGPGFSEKLEQDGDFIWWYKKGRLEVAIQMKKQSIAAGRHTVEWHAAEAPMAFYLQRLAEQLGCHNIDVKHTPAKSGQVAP